MRCASILPPCLEDSEIMWFIPMSSKIDKYKIIIEDKIKKYKKCDTIVIGNYRGRDHAFLLQNMFPITPIPPRYLEGWIVDLIDNIASIYERCYSSAIAFASTINLVVVTLLGLLKF